MEKAILWILSAVLCLSAVFLGSYMTSHPLQSTSSQEKNYVLKGKVSTYNVSANNQAGGQYLKDNQHLYYVINNQLLVSWFRWIRNKWSIDRGLCGLFKYWKSCSLLLWFSI